MNIGWELASIPQSVVVRLNTDNSQDCVGVHLRLKSAQDFGLVSSACII